MAVHLSSFRPPGGPYGYGCKVWIAREVEQKYLGGFHYFWFSRQLNPTIQNGLSSNPLRLYSEIDEAVKKEDALHSKIKQLRAEMAWVFYTKIAPKDLQLARALRRAVRRAPLDMFRPQLWRLDLSKQYFTSSRFQAGKADWDEQLIKDLQQGEFEVIVE